MCGADAPRHAGYFMKTFQAASLKIVEDFPFTEDFPLIKGKSSVIMIRLAPEWHGPSPRYHPRASGSTNHSNIKALTANLGRRAMGRDEVEHAPVRPPPLLPWLLPWLLSLILILALDLGL
jgi:hypothetical protein